jgi:heat shock protein HslJ
LLGTEWRLEELAGAKTLGNVEATLTFPQAGRAAGNASCNRFAGPVKIHADSISFGALAMTRMACAEAINAQEARFAKALEEAERFSISGNRLSIYSKGSQQPMNFVRTKPS